MRNQRRKLMHSTKHGQNTSVPQERDCGRSTNAHHVLEASTRKVPSHTTECVTINEQYRALLLIGEPTLVTSEATAAAIKSFARFPNETEKNYLSEM